MESHAASAVSLAEGELQSLVVGPGPGPGPGPKMRRSLREEGRGGEVGPRTEGEGMGMETSSSSGREQRREDEEGSGEEWEGKRFFTEEKEGEFEGEVGERRGSVSIS